MIIKIDTETKQVWFDDVETHLRSDIATEFAKYRGVTEYEGIVGQIQKWFYGYVSKTSWCATSLSYFAFVCGVLDSFGGKHENVYNMMVACKAQADKGKGTFFDKYHIPETIERNDILFWLWDGKIMNTTSSKHVGVAEYKSNTDKIFCIGGNQKDKICTLEYDKKFLYAVYRLK